MFQIGFASKVDFGGHEFRVVSCDFVDRLVFLDKATIHEVTRNNTNQKTLPVLAQYDFWGKAFQISILYGSNHFGRKELVRVFLPRSYKHFVPPGLSYCAFSEMGMS